MHIFKAWSGHLYIFQKNRINTVGGIHCPFIFIVKMPEKRLRSNCEKESKFNLRIIFKPHAYFLSIMKTSVKFQKNRIKTVGGVAHTKYPLSKKGSSNCKKKVLKIKLRIISKLHAHLQTMVKTYVHFQKNRIKTVGGVVHTRYTLSIHFHCKNV